MFGVWAAPAAPKTIQKYGGFAPHIFCLVSRAPGAAQTPKIDDFRPAQRSCTKNLSVSYLKLKFTFGLSWNDGFSGRFGFWLDGFEWFLAARVGCK